VVLVVIALAANPAAKEGMIGKEDAEELEDCSTSGSAEDGVLQWVECCIMVKEKNREDRESVACGRRWSVWRQRFLIL
jgi:hypothetical protein